MSPKAVLPQFLERLCVSIRSAKARAVLRRGYTADDAIPSALERAATALAADLYIMFSGSAPRGRVSPRRGR